MEIAQALEFIREHPMSVLATHRRDGAPQMSYVTAGVDDDERVVISTRETAMKTKNLRRDPRASLFAMDDTFRASVQVDGTVEIVSLPEAMEPLVEYYRRISGEHPDWDEYRRAMQEQSRVLVRITVERAGPDTWG
jgi:PPOX class probable F420-dependent enzyme